MPPPAASWVSATFAPAPTGPRQTARQSASSRRCCASGPTGAYTEAPQSDAANSPAGSIATTTTESTAPSAIARQLLVSTSCLGTTWLGTTASPGAQPTYGDCRATGKGLQGPHEAGRRSHELD